MPAPRSRRVTVDTYSHRWECECGWLSQVAENGRGEAGAALVRHTLTHQNDPNSTPEGT
jgi:hypothetical protein